MFDRPTDAEPIIRYSNATALDILIAEEASGDVERAEENVALIHTIIRWVRVGTGCVLGRRCLRTTALLAILGFRPIFIALLLLRFGPASGTASAATG